MIAGSYVYKNSKVHKVPANASEGLSTPLLGLLEKNSFKKMLEFIAKYDPANPQTHLGMLLHTGLVLLVA
jgi:Rab GDP dissociation inhibitor